MPVPLLSKTTTLVGRPPARPGVRDHLAKLRRDLVSTYGAGGDRMVQVTHDDRHQPISSPKPCPKSARFAPESRNPD